MIEETKSNRTVDLDLGFSNHDWDLIKEALKAYQENVSDAEKNEDLGTIYDTIDRVQTEHNEAIDKIDVSTAIIVTKQNMRDMDIETDNLELLESFIDAAQDADKEILEEEGWSEKNIDYAINDFLDEYENNDPVLVHIIVDEVERLESEVF